MTDENVAIYKDPGFCSKTSWIQLGYGFWVNSVTICIGLSYGFSAVALPQLTDPQSPIKLTISDKAWIASVLSLSSPFGCLTSGMLIDRFGRKFALIACEIPLCIGWLYIGFAKTALDIIIGRVITGLGCGMAMGVPRVYTTETSLPNMRGVIGAFPNVLMACGLTLQASMGSMLDWQILCYVSGGISLCLLVTNFLLPETPYYVLMKDNSVENARATLRKFRAKNYNIDHEMEELIEFKTVNEIRRLTFRELVMALFKPSSCKPFITTMTYIIIGQMSGITILIFYTVEMLKESESTVDPHQGNIMLAATRLVCGIATSMILFKVGRRPLALISGLGVGAVCISTGVYIMYTSKPSVFPQLCYITYIIFATPGYYTLPLLIMFELYPLQVRGLLGGISVSLLNLLVFGATSTYPYLRKKIGFPYTMIFFGVSSLAGSLFVYLCLPETKTLTLQEIEEYYNKRRPTLTSSRDIIAAQMKSAANRKSTLNRNLNKSLERHTPDQINKSSKTVVDAANSAGAEESKNVSVKVDTKTSQEKVDKPD